MTDADLAFLPAVDAIAAIAAGRLSAVAWTAAAQERIRHCDPPLHAFIHLDEANARVEALRRDRAREAGHALLPLEGVPVAVKDVIDVAGMRTTLGASANAHLPAAVRDAQAVQRMRDAGCIVLGKTNTPPYAAFPSTTSRLAGTTLNPWNLAFGSGGSSGGSAVAVATGMCALALGTDLGGSVRGPAAWNGVFGIRPTAGRVPADRSSWVDDTMDVVGAFARSPRDLRAWLATVEDYRDRDVDGLPRPDRLRIAYTCDLAGAMTVSSSVRACFDRAMQDLGAAGLTLRQRSPRVDTALAAIRPLRALRALASMPDVTDDVLALDNPPLAQFMQWARTLSLADIAAAAKLRTQSWRDNEDFFVESDLLLLPACQYVGMRRDDVAPPVIDGTALPDTLSAWYATYAITLLGWPAVVVPIGLAAEGLPVGIQVVAPRHAEQRALAFATFLEMELGWRALRPPL